LKALESIFDRTTAALAVGLLAVIL